MKNPKEYESASPINPAPAHETRDLQAVVQSEKGFIQNIDSYFEYVPAAIVLLLSGAYLAGKALDVYCGIRKKR